MTGLTAGESSGLRSKCQVQAVLVALPPVVYTRISCNASCVLVFHTRCTVTASPHKQSHVSSSSRRVQSNPSTFQPRAVHTGDILAYRVHACTCLATRVQPALLHYTCIRKVEERTVSEAMRSVRAGEAASPLTIAHAVGHIGACHKCVPV